MEEADHHVENMKPGPRTEIKDVGHDTKIRDDNQRMTLLEKLMLSATLWSVEASSAFQQLYAVPLLQTLGIPLSLIPLIAIISGPTAALLLPSVGWFMDRGSNPWRRKNIALLFGFGLLFCGQLCMLVASILHVNDLLEYSAPEGSSAEPNFLQNKSPVSLCTTPDLLHSSSESLLKGTGYENDTVQFKNLTDPSAEESIKEMSTRQSHSGSFKACLGVLGLILLDTGFDSSSACARTFVLASSPRSEHTSLLTIGLIMASAGGVSTAVLGLVDIASILGLSHLEGGRLTIQTTIQAAIILILVLLYLCVTILSGRRLVARTYQTDNDYYPIANSDISVPPHSSDLHYDSDHSESFAAGNIQTSIETSIQSHCRKSHDLSNRQNLTVPEEPPSDVDESVEEFFSEHAPLLFEKEVTPSKTEKVNGYGINSVSVLHGNNFCEGTDSSQQCKASSLKRGVDENLTDTAASESKEQHESCCRLGFKARLAFITLSMFFAVGQVNMYGFTISDYVGKVIYRGNPTASPESESLARYQDSLSMASWGFLCHYGSYFLTSMAQTRLLSFLGFRVEFVLSHLLQAGSAILLALTARLEAFFMMAVTAGFQRACFFAVPFAVVNDIVEDMALSTGKRRVGLVMSAVTVSMPLGYCATVFWIGAAEELTGNVSLPLWVCTACGCLATSFFLALGKV